MQVPFPQNLVWQQVIAPPQQVLASSEQYVTAIPPQGVVFQHQMPTDGLVRIPLIVKDGWVMQGVPPEPPPPTYLTQPLQYVTLPQGTRLSGGAGLPVEGSSLNMRDVTESLPSRPILVPRRPGVPSFCNITGRTLRRNNVAVRRPSEEYLADLDAFAGTPTKKLSLRDDVDRPDSLATNESLIFKSRDAAILEIVEYYFSDESLSKNAYLLKQVSHNEHGYVSLKCIAALKRIKSLTRDDRVVAQCILKSHKLELSEDGTMVRRKCPLPLNIEPPRFIRSVIAINLPMETPTIEAVTSIFVSYGDLTQVRVLKPGKMLPAYLKVYQAWIPDLGKSYCALVEFENQEEAQRACREINMKNRTSDSLRVALLKPGARLRRTLYRKYKDNEESVDQQDFFSEYCSRNSAAKLEESRECDASASGSGSESDIASHSIDSMHHKRNKFSLSDSGYSYSSGDEHRTTVGVTQTLQQTSPSPYQHRVFGDEKDPVQHTHKGKIPFNILRFPIGPKDNEKGFIPGFRCLSSSGL